MAGELKGFSSALSSVFVAFNAANQVWNGAAFEAWNDSNIATYAIAATQLGASRWWTANAPAGTVVFLLLSGAIAVPLAIADRGTLAIPNAAAGASNGLWTSDGTNNRLIDTVTTVTGNVNGHMVGDVQGNVGGHVVGSVGSVLGNVGGNLLGFVASGMEGNILGNLQGSVQSVTNPATIVTAVWAALLTALTTAGSIGAKLANAIFTGGFTGPSSVTLTFKDNLGAAVPNVEFTVLGQGSMRANSSGVAAFGMNDGTYSVVANVTNLIIFPTTTLTVSGTTSLTVTGATASIPTPPTPAQTTAYGVTRDAHGTPVGSIAITFELENADQAADVYDGGAFTSTSDSSGNLLVVLLKGAKYGIRTPSGKFMEFETSTADTQALPNVLGPY